MNTTKDTLKKTSISLVDEHIKNENPWYVSSQFQWANKPSIRPIYDNREKYFIYCIEKARKKFGPNLKLLDVGCGDGYWLQRLQHIDRLELSGIDYNPLRVERARKVAKCANIIHGDLGSYLLNDNFDIILLSQVIEHVEDDVGFLQKIRSLLRPNGVMILGTPNEGSLLQQWALRRTGNLGKTDHIHFYTERDIESKIVRGGFIIDSVMREVFYPGIDRAYYSLLAKPWGFFILNLMTKLWPTQCSGYYFECRAG